MNIDRFSARAQVGHNTIRIHQQLNTNHLKCPTQCSTENVGIVKSIVTFGQLDKVDQRIVLNKK